MSESVPRLAVKNIRVRFGNTIALDGVDFEINPGEVVALIGENGAGKSTLMKVLAGSLVPDSGTMELGGNPYLPRNPHEARAAGVAMIYQELSLAPSLSVQENVFLGMELLHNGLLDRAEMNKRAAEAVSQLGHDIPVHARVRDLSVSDQQLVELARAVAVGCDVLILDEPTSSITKKDTERLFELIERLKAQGLSIVYISHFLEEVQRIADRFVVLRDGCTVGGGTMQDVSLDRIVTMMVGRELSEMYPRSQRPVGEVLLELQSLEGLHDGKLRHATLQLKSGEVLGIFGLVGSGRTELLRGIFGLDKVKQGNVKVGAYSTHRPQVRASWKHRLGLVSEDRKSEGLALSRTIAENMILSCPEKSERGGILRPQLIEEQSRQWIDRLQVRCRNANQKILELSGGNQQKVAIARLLHHDVDVLLLDEPTRGIDVGSKKQIYEVIDQAACSGKAVLMISSYLPELLGTCDRIAVMCRGSLGEPRAVKDVTEESIMLEATTAGVG